MVGKTLGHYEILEPLGKGGMGEVYAAEDTKLHRQVALKVLPPELAANPERRQRFEREATAIAALDHPNIVTVHSIEEAEGLHFITMQLVEGKTLSELIPRNGFPLEKFFELGIPLADAISAAHQQGIAHRDLKPSNIMVSSDGRVRVLDFGLAKLMEPDLEEGESSQLATALTEQEPGLLTEEGKILGTVAYMSPEQAEGKSVDHRTDIFSLGIILYEMATGERPFKGDTKVSIMSSIVKETPTSVTELNRNLPRHTGRIIKHALEKDVTRRYQSALDLRNDLEELAEEVRSGEAVPFRAAVEDESRARRSAVPVYLGVAVVVAAALAAGYLLRGLGISDGSDAGTWTTTQLTNLPGAEVEPSISPDGEFIVYAGDAAGNWDVYRQRVGGGNAFNLTTSSTDHEYNPVFSPDGAHVAFHSDRDGGGLFVMGATGEAVRQITDFGFNPAWSPDGREIVFSTFDSPNPLSFGSRRELWVVNVSSGERRLLHAPGVLPHWSPNGHRIAYFDIEGGNREIWTIPAGGGEAVRVTNEPSLDWNPVWSPDGRYLYFSSDRGGTRNIWRVRVNERTGELEGEPEPISTSETSQGFLSLSDDGRRIAYASQRSRSNLQRVAFDPASRNVSGEPEWITRGSRYVWTFDLSPDDEWIVYVSGGQREDLFRIRADGSELNRMNDDSHRDRRPEWSPDGDRIAFYSDRSGRYEIWTVKPNGSGATQLTHWDRDTVIIDPNWSPDGSRLTFVEYGVTTHILAVDTPWEQQDLTSLPPIDPEGDSMRVGAWSPDGQWLAGTRHSPDGTEGGIIVYSLKTQQYKRLTERGRDPIWLNDNQQLLFRRGPSIFLLDINVGEATELLSAEPDSYGSSLSVSSDGRWIYMSRIEQEEDIYLLTLEE